MVPEPAQVTRPTPPARGAEPARQKVRIRFRKGGGLRLVSHHDLLRCFERMLRRAALPFHSTQGFHPKPRLVFALSLPLGVVGCEEVVELELDEDLGADEVRRRLAEQAPPGLEILSARPVARRATAQVRRAGYRVALPEHLLRGLPPRVAELLAAVECWVERTRTHFPPAPQQPPDRPAADGPRRPAHAPPARRLNLRPYVADVRVLPDALEIDVWVTPTGTARPDEILHLLGLGDALAGGAVLERTRLELHDETEVVSGP
jgi:hypothetical protein